MPCGKPSCRCMGKPPRLHGPYYQWSYKLRGKTVSMRLTSEQAKLCQEWLENHRRLKNIIRKSGSWKSFPSKKRIGSYVNDPEVIRAGDRLRRCSRDGPESAPRKASCEGAASARAKRRVATTGSSRDQHTARGTPGSNHSRLCRGTQHAGGSTHLRYARAHRRTLALEVPAPWPQRVERSAQAWSQAKIWPGRTSSADRLGLRAHGERKRCQSQDYRAVTSSLYLPGHRGGHQLEQCAAHSSPS